MNGVALVLKLHGVPYVFYGGQGTYTPETPDLPEGVDYRVLQVIDLVSIKNSSIENKLPRYGGVGDAATFTLNLVDVANHLELLFTRTLDDVTWVRLGASLIAEATTDEILAETTIPEDFPAEGLGYIGMETFRYSEIDGDTFILPENGRGVLDSQIVPHLKDNIPARSFKPVATKYPIDWHNRPVRLFLHKVIDNVVQLTPERELLRGYIDAPPTPIQGGWSLSLKSELGTWERFIGTSLETTGMVEGFYYSDGVNACRFNVREALPHNCVSGADMNCVVMEEHGLADGEVVIRGVNTLRDAFGVARGHFDGDPSTVLLKLSNRGLPQEPSVVSSYGAEGSDTITLATDNMPFIPDAAVGDPLQTYHRVVQLAYLGPPDDDIMLAEGLHRWPEAAIVEFNAKANCHITDDAAFKFIDCFLSPDGTQLTVAVQNYVYDEANPPQLYPVRMSRSRDSIWYGIMRGVDEQIDAVEDAPGVPELDGETPLGYPVGHHQLHEPARAFWNGGEYLLVKDNIFQEPVGGVPLGVTIKVKGRKDVQLEYDEVLAQEYDGEVIGYRLHITPESIQRWRDDGKVPFGVWNINGEVQKPEIHPTGILSGAPQIMLLEMMHSSGTAEFQGEYDRLPQAMALGTDIGAVNSAHIGRTPTPPILHDVRDVRVGPSTMAKDFMRGYLMAMGMALVMRQDDNREQKITLVPIRAAAREATHSVLDGVRSQRDWVRDGRPRSGQQDKLQSTWFFEVNYDIDTGKYLRTPTVHDADVIDRLRGASTPAEKITLQGVNIDSDDPLLFLFQQLRSRFGKQTKVFSGKIMWSVGQHVDIGDVLRVTTIDGVDENRRPKVLTADMLVTRIAHNFIGMSCEVTLEYLPTKYGPVGPAATVLEVTSADVVVLDNGAKWFRDNGATVPSAGIPVLAVHVGRETTVPSANKTITAMAASGNNFNTTITGHGLSAGDRIRPRGYDDSNAWLRTFVHMAKAGTAGVGVGLIKPWKYL